MADKPLDDLDKIIIHALQGDARHTSASTIAEGLDVTASTVRHRIRKLEDRDVIRGYHLDVDYERAGFQLHTLIVCTAPITERESLAREAMGVPGVVSIQEIMTGAENVLVNAVGIDHDDLSRIGQDLNELGLEIVDEDLVRNYYYQPFHRFAGTE